MSANPFTTTRIKALTERINVHTKAQIIEVTTRRTDEIQTDIARTFGAEAPIRRYVDGQLGKALSEVDPHGFTLTQFHTFGMIVDAAIRLLIETSPYGPEEGGHYQDDHWLFVNDTRRDFALEGAVIDLAPEDVVVIVNPRPYARLIEGRPMNPRSRRMSDRRPGLSAQAPNGVYEISGRALQRRFGNLATFTFSMRAVSGFPKTFPSLTIVAR